VFDAFNSGQAEPEKASSCHSDNSDNLGIPENIGNSDNRKHEHHHEHHHHKKSDEDVKGALGDLQHEGGDSDNEGKL
jgi:hypothetical protein